MGELNRFNIGAFECSVFVETGTGVGTGVQYASKFPCLKKLHTIEIVPQLYEKVKEQFNDYRIFFHLGNSVDVLKNILPSIKKEEKIIFWMDAHFPGVDFGIGGNTYIFNDANMPLEKELNTIKECRDTLNDTFIIDDLRLYEDGNYELGNIDIGRPKSSQFIIDLFSNTHKIEKDYRDQGFLIIRPKGI